MKSIIRKRAPGGTPSAQPRAYEAPHAALSRRAAAEGFVLLKNDGCLPLGAGSRVALYGAGAVRTVKGGTGSGDVNERRVVSIREGLENAGFEIADPGWLDVCEADYAAARQAWKACILAQYARNGGGGMAFFDAYSANPFKLPAGPAAVSDDADIAIYVLSRIAGEAKDRVNAPGDYRLTDAEHAMLRDICQTHETVIVLLNTGGVVDLSFVDEFPQIRGLMLILQPGMEAGNAVADALLGAVNPSGRLTDTWALRYEDYPGALEYSHNNGDTGREFYNEGIYVGYRYFDSFDIPARYGFGAGLSYTAFDVRCAALSADADGNVTAAVDVTNAGDRPGRQVVQLYAMPPEGRLEKEVRRLAAFGKTGLLAPGETARLELTFGPEALASYDEAAAAWVLEPGRYGVFIGGSLQDSALCGWLALGAEKALEKVRNICLPRAEIDALTLPPQARRARCAALTAGADVPEIAWDLSGVETRAVEYDAPEALDDEAARRTETLDTEQLIRLVVGDPGSGQGNALGSAGVAVPGSAGQTSACALEQGVADIVLADGPAGLRLSQTYTLENGAARMLPLEASFEHGFFYDGGDMPGEKYYQFCTAVPVGTLLAQTWDIDLIEEIGRMIGDEMRMFNVTLWLAPGMNLHRNPLCGRNFEYYSEDPFVSGRMAAAMTRGVQSRPGCGTTIKHFCCNNQEDNRMGSDSILSERALRELYLRGFGIAIREAQPLAIMTSYNLVNGVHAANNRDLCTLAARREFGFRGLIMTDWTTTENGPDCTASGCVRAGNDLVMPGQFADQDDIRAALGDGTLSLDDLRACATRVVRTVMQSDRYED